MLKNADVQSKTERYLELFRCAKTALSGVIEELSLSVAALSKRPSSKSLRPGCWLFAVGCFLLTIIEFKMGLYLSISQSMFALSMLLINCSVSSSKWAGTGSCRQE